MPYQSLGRNLVSKPGKTDRTANTTTQHKSAAALPFSQKSSCGIPLKKPKNYAVENNAVSKDSISMKTEIENFLRQPSSWAR